ncbi:acyl carrier protein [Candidatus Pelagibacter sp. HIMB1521]|uniref:acyl carrier protein n=1 Tax=Candidatus Pelagibacter sp. HIMB1521 TaxID=3413344 RepID=UPI003F871F58
MKLDKIFEIFGDILDLNKDNFNLDTKPSDFDEWDSVATVNIIIALEDEFGVKFKLEDIQQLKKIKDFVELLERYQK